VILLASPKPCGISTTIELAEPVTGWQPGDKLFLPATRALEIHTFSQAETVTIESIDGRIVSLTEPLKFSHDGDGANLPHAAHMSGNITFRSDNPDGVRGHILVADRARVDVNDAVFRDLGRTTFKAAPMARSQGSAWTAPASSSRMAASSETALKATSSGASRAQAEG